MSMTATSLRKWIETIIRCNRIDVHKGDHFGLAPTHEYSDAKLDGFDWDLIHLETTNHVEYFELEEGETPEDLLKLLQEAFPEHHFALPMFHKEEK